MKSLHKLVICGFLILSALQLSAKYKDRIFVINNYGGDIIVTSFHYLLVDKQVIQRGNAACIAEARISNIQVYNNPGMTQPYWKAGRAKVKTGNVIVVTKGAKTPSLKVYKNYDAFIDANPDFILGSNTVCPHVLPELVS